MNKKPTVSVIIPTYNRAYLIGKAIKSVLNQSYQDFELIVIDDASTDSTEDKIKEYQKKNNRIKYIKHMKNKGSSAARNTGIKAAKGDYIAFQDSDDEWLPGKLEKQMNKFETAPLEIGVIYSGFWRIQGDKKDYIPSNKITEREGDIHTELLKENFITTQSIVVRRECFGKAGMFDENLPRLQDWELVLRLSKYYRFLFIDEPLVISYYSNESISADKEAYIIALELILKKHFEDFNQFKHILSKHYYILGKTIYSEGDLVKSRRYFFSAIEKYPLNIDYLIGYLKSFLSTKAYNKLKNIYHRFK